VQGVGGFGGKGGGGGVRETRSVAAVLRFACRLPDVGGCTTTCSHGA